MALAALPPNRSAPCRHDKVTVSFDFVPEGGSWKIDDIRGKESSLKEVSKQFLAE